MLIYRSLIILTAQSLLKPSVTFPLKSLVIQLYCLYIKVIILTVLTYNSIYPKEQLTLSIDKSHQEERLVIISVIPEAESVRATCFNFYQLPTLKIIRKSSSIGKWLTRNDDGSFINGTLTIKVPWLADEGYAFIVGKTGRVRVKVVTV